MEGHPSWQCLLGEAYQTGDGVRRDCAEAEKWYLKSARQGVGAAQFNLGLMYESGDGVPKNYQQAAHWYHKAADDGLCSAQFRLGLMYRQGRGVPQDYVASHKWLNLAASCEGDTPDEKKYMEARDAIAKLMTREQIADAQRLAKEWTLRRNSYYIHDVVRGDIPAPANSGSAARQKQRYEEPVRDWNLGDGDDCEGDGD